MKKLLLLLLVITFQSGCAIASEDIDLVEQSIGRLILLHDSKFSYENDLNPFGSAEVFQEFSKLYEKNIRKLPVSERVDFFWAGMWHLDFDGHVMEEFQELIMKDCGEEYIQRLESYIEKERELQRNKTTLYLSEQVLAGLELIRDRPSF